jgi:glutathione S-transferase
VFKAYGFWSAVLMLKVLAMAVFTSQARQKKKAVTNPEDLTFLKDVQDAKPVENDPDVERVRR